MRRIVQLQDEVISQHMESLNTNTICAEVIFSYGVMAVPDIQPINKNLILLAVILIQIYL